MASGASGACLRSHAAADPVQNVGLAGNEFDIVTVLPLQVLQLLGDGLLQRLLLLHRLKRVAPFQ